MNCPLREILTVVLLGFGFSCTTVDVEQEEFPDQLVPRQSLSQPMADDLSNLGHYRRFPLKPGSVRFLIKVEEPRSHRIEGARVEKRSRHDFSLVELFHGVWKDARDALMKTKIFDSKAFSEGMDNGFDVHALEAHLKVAREEKKDYLAILSVREALSAPNSVYHSALKSLTLNLYDLFPFFKYNLSPFRVSYSAIWDLVLIDVKSGKASFSVSALTSVKAFDRGHDFLFPDEELYKRIAMRSASEKFVDRFQKRIEQAVR